MGLIKTIKRKHFIRKAETITPEELLAEYKEKK